MAKPHFILVLLALLSLPVVTASAAPRDPDILPDKPEPQVSVHRNPVTYPFRATVGTLKDVVTFKDKQFSAVALLYIGAYGADMISTKMTLDKFDKCGNPGDLRGCTFEEGGIFNGSRNAGKIALAYGGITVANIVIAHEWKKHVHNRFLRDLWSAGMLYQSSEHIEAAVGNSKLGEKQ